MPRPKGSKKDKNQLNKIILTSSSSRTSTSSSLSPTQTSVLLPPMLSNINCTNDFVYDDMHSIKTSVNTSMINKGGRPKKSEISSGNDENLMMINSPTSSSSELRTNEIGGNRVVVNPAVLRYLDQNQNMQLLSDRKMESMYL